MTSAREGTVRIATPAVHRLAALLVLPLVFALATRGEAQQTAALSRWGLTPADFSTQLGARLLERAGFPARFHEVMQAAEQGDPHAMTLVGVAYHLGIGTKKDPGRAAQWIEKAARAGEPRAMNNLGTFYGTAVGVPKDPIRALEWTRKAMEAGNALAQHNMAMRYAAGNGVPKSDAAALRLTHAAAAQGFDNATYYLGLGHLYGWYGLTSNADSAAFWFHRAAARGLGSAFHMLGILHATGRGVAADTAEALRLWNLGAEAGDGPSMFRLGVAYFRGTGVLGDYAAAARWFDRAAAAGDAFAPVWLAWMHEEGHGVIQDPRRSVAILRTAAERGSGPASLRLSRHYYRGIGVGSDDGQALRWAERAVQAGEEEGHYWAAYARYRSGDVAAATISMRAAEAAGVDDAKESLVRWEEARKRRVAQAQQPRERKSGGFLRGVLGAGIGFAAAQTYGASAEQTIGAVAKGIQITNPDSDVGTVAGAAGDAILEGAATAEARRTTPAASAASASAASASAASASATSPSAAQRTPSTAATSPTRAAPASPSGERVSASAASPAGERTSAPARAPAAPVPSAASTDTDANRCVTEPETRLNDAFAGSTSATVLNGCGQPVDVRICLMAERKEGGAAWNCGVDYGVVGQARASHSTFQATGPVFVDARVSGSKRPLAYPPGYRP